MNDRETTIEDLFHAAAELPAAQRAAFLDDRCAGDADMRREVESLLAADATALDGVIAGAAGLVGHADGPDTLPARIGEFEIVRLIGEGGMGRVYEARQASPRRTIALKVIRAGLLSRDAARRFSREATVLANLKHPGIAQVFQAGTAAASDGSPLPYFAMELVSGRSLTAFARDAALNTRQTLELWAAVCDAVQHAHQRGVIHRDLKPGNILVETADGQPPQPKILDFGIARLTDQASEAGAATLGTEAGQIIGTLAYMSPEQVEGDSARLDTRSDVYALGVIGYELFAGKPPLDVATKTLVEAARTICTVEPRRLGLVNPALAGDVETIVAKALEKDRDRRYPSAAELAADIRRHLRDEPISARPASTFYQLSRFARRNRALAGGVLVAAVALVAGTALAAWQAVAATRQRDAARQAEARAQAVNDFLLKDVFALTNLANLGPNATVSQLLRAASGRVEQRFGASPIQHAEVENMLMELSFTVGDAEAAAAHAAKALDLVRRSAGPDSKRAVELEVQRVHLLANAARTAELLEAIPPMKERVRRVLGPTSPQALLVGVLEGIALVQDNRPREAIATLTPLLDEHRDSPSAGQLTYLLGMNTLVQALKSRGELDGALEWSGRCVDWTDAKLPPESGHRMAIRSLHGSLLAGAGMLAEAEPLVRETLEAEERTLAPGDLAIAGSRRNYGVLLMKMGRHAEARAQLEKAVAEFNAGAGEADWHACEARRALFDAIRASGDTAGAEAFILREVETCRRIKGGADNDPLVMMRRRMHLELLIEADRLDEAEAILAEVEAACPRSEVWEIREAWAGLDLAAGKLHAARGRTEPARACFERARDALAGQTQPHVVKVRAEAEAELAKLSN